MLTVPFVQPFTVAHGAIGVDATAFLKVIPPYTPPAGPFLYSGTNPKKFGDIRTVVKKVVYTTGDTAHLIQIARPLNYSTVNGAVLKNTSTLILNDDPGIYSTAYKYNNANSKIPSQVADNGIATNDYIVVQLADGTWHVSKVTVSTLTLTLATALPNPTGVGGVNDGALVYFYGNITSDKDPATGLVNAATTIALSTTRDATWADSDVGVVDAIHPGDPLLFYSPNTTHAGTLEWVSGVYVKN